MMQDVTTPFETCKATVEKYLALLNDHDATGAQFARLYAADGVVIDPVGADPLTNPSDIAAFYDALPRVRTARLDELRIAGGQAAFVFTLEATLDESTMTISPLDVMTINEDGSIAQMAAYWSDQDVAFS